MTTQATDRERARELYANFAGACSEWPPEQCVFKTNGDGCACEHDIGILSEALASVRAETVEQAALAAKEFGENHRVVTKKRDGSSQTRFSAYDVDYHIKAACNFVAEDIRALLKTGDTDV